MTEIDRISRKKRRHLYISRECDMAAHRLLPEHVTFTQWVESAMWSALLEQYGEQAVLEAVEDAHADMTEEELLAEENRTSYRLPA